ncbi:hypothetical protein CDAR_389431 [Caerostris darwini]|uniref:Fibronectin type-III domain-containing protein n=1 Tax=Caerostris darwini TaxID=1538125 RepID=A0AAV4RGP9_9ARAC|nr:hypothetical protein CDAR_389431 [Caerostris darwini]
MAVFLFQPPETPLQFGKIKGYYVGYKIKDSKEKYVYKTLENKENFREERVLTNLERNTKYVVRVQAFNSKGAGPPSDDVEGGTLEEGICRFH